MLVYIQSRYSSKRLPGKALKSILGIPMVVLAYKRALMGLSNEAEVRVLTSTHESDDILADCLESNAIPYFRGSLNNVLERFVRAAEGHDSGETVVRLTADNVVPDGLFIDELSGQFKNACSRYMGAMYPQIGIPYGMGCEMFYLGDLREAYNRGYSNYDSEHVTPAVRKKYGVTEFTSKFSSKAWEKKSCTVDTLEEYNKLLLFFESNPNMLFAPWYQILKKWLGET